MKTLKLKAGFELFLIISLTFLSGFVFSSPTVNAAEANVCCEKTLDDKYCQYVDSAQCKIGLKDLAQPAKGSYTQAETTCDKTTFCKPGCCNLLTKGDLCAPNMGKAGCEAAGGSFTNDVTCSQPECSKGCCTMGSNCKLTTETGCKSLFKTYAPELTYSFKPVSGELECLNLCLEEKKGCCVSEDGCKKLTPSECEARDGKYSSELCSKQPTGTCDECRGEKKTKCVEGTTDIYSFDSCGNQEGVSKKCDYSAGLICGDNAGKNECDDVNCAKTYDNPVVDENGDKNYENDGGRRTNGEEWCEYEANNGPSVDLPGTRHYKHLCINGKERVEPCRELREEVCIEKTRPLSENQNAPTFSSAKCIKNDYETCSDCTTEACCRGSQERACVWIAKDKSAKEQLLKQAKEKCEETDEEGNPKRECIFDEESTDGFCTPLVPPGFPRSQGQEFCGVASQKEGNTVEPLIIHWEKLIGDWNCENNCIGYTLEYAQTQNSLCGAYGDCGAKYNLAGTWGNQGFKRDCGKNTEEYKDEEIYNIEDPNDIEDQTLLSTISRFGNGDNKANDLLDECKPSLPDPKAFEKWLLSDNLLRLSGTFEKNFGLNDGQYALIGSGAVGGAAAIVLAVAYFGYTAAGVPVAGALGLGTTLSSSIGSSLIPVVGWIIAGAIVLAAAITAIIFAIFGDEYDGTISTDCKPWQAPSGGKYCNLCHEKGKRAGGQEIDLTFGGMEGHECTEYRCESLGKGCRFEETNEGSRCLNQLCNSDTSSSFIKLSEKTTQQEKCTSLADGGLSITCASQIKENTARGNRNAEINFINANNNFLLEFETSNEKGEKDFATCKMDQNPATPFEDMDIPFNQETSSIHNLTIKVADLPPGKTLNYYVRCVDSCDNGATTDPYKLTLNIANGPDLNAATLLNIEPENNAFLPNTADKKEIILTLSKKISTNANVLDAGCRASTQDLPYADMKTKLLCPTPSFGKEQTCKTILQDIKEGPNTYYFKCKDGKGNTNVDSLIAEGYTLTRSAALNITSYQCNDKDCTGIIKTRNMKITAITENGAEAGKATCGLSSRSVGSAAETEITFEETDSTNHKTSIGPLNEGAHTYYLVCEDKAKNIATQKITFTTEIDRIAPLMRNVYTVGDVLFLETNEEATCKYSTTTPFNYDTATGLVSSNKLLHQAAATGISTFYLGCKDDFENPMSEVVVYKVQ